MRGTHILESPDGETSHDIEGMQAVRGTHQLESPDRETSQGMERMQASKGYSLPGDPRQRDESEHGKNANQ